MNRTLPCLFAVCVLSAAACGSPASFDVSPRDGGDSATLDAACTASAQAQCARRDACTKDHYLITRTYGDTATCVKKLHDSCVSSVSAPGSGNTASNVMACAGAYTSISCDDYLNANTDAFPAACKTQVGTLANGGACRFAGQCQSTFCAIPTGLECGSCAPLPTVGTPCNGPGAVSSCGGHALDCVGAISDDRGFTAGTCAAWVTTVGSTCDATHPCGAGLSCTPASSTATTRTCQPAGQAVGTPCNGASNPGCDGALGLACNGKTHTCEAILVAPPGTACGTGADGSLTGCAGNGDCMGATSTSNKGSCRAAAADGAACDVVSGPNCEPSSSCVSGGGSASAGTCQAPSAASCT